MLSYKGVHFSKTHDIRKLLKEIKQNNIELDNDYTDLINLTYYSVEGRYAIIYEDLEDANKYIKILDKLVEFVKAEINR